MGEALSIVDIWEEVTTLPVYEKPQLPSEDSGMSPVMLLLVGRLRTGHTGPASPTVLQIQSWVLLPLKGVVIDANLAILVTGFLATTAL